MRSEYRRLKSAAPREQTLSLLIYHQSLTQAHLSTLKQDLATAKTSLKGLREQLLVAERQSTRDMFESYISRHREDMDKL